MSDWEDFCESKGWNSGSEADYDKFIDSLGKLCISAHHAAQFEKMTALSLSW